MATSPGKSFEEMRRDILARIKRREKEGKYSKDELDEMKREDFKVMEAISKQQEAEAREKRVASMGVVVAAQWEESARRREKERRESSRVAFEEYERRKRERQERERREREREREEKEQEEREREKLHHQMEEERARRREASRRSRTISAGRSEPQGHREEQTARMTSKRSVPQTAGPLTTRKLKMPSPRRRDSATYNSAAGSDSPSMNFASLALRSPATEQSATIEQASLAHQPSPYPVAMDVDLPITETTQAEPSQIDPAYPYIIPEWYNKINTRSSNSMTTFKNSKQYELRSPLNYLKNLIKYCEEDLQNPPANSSKLDTNLDNLRDSIHKAEFFEVSPFLLRITHMLDNGLHRIFAPTLPITFPLDLRADAYLLFTRWSERFFENKLLRGTIPGKKKVGEDVDRGNNGITLDPAWPKKSAIISVPVTSS
ncbi:hypothetical protein M011DRAFT_473880 [Sporormia fimetaria CBS 119925]|uniref:Uncharacterized protein n=1 Tax=Sporormia fimetaria CBS 119925 TaxID=1340428 RepID=A0A6A6VNT4_9PLEO|nr:hypothetical protein M011DRAFT_473880 [Sporormia fimetaria CBS 119925]